jgi:heat shock protein HslJ
MKKSAGGSGGCNSFGGTLSIKGNKIRISQVISTQMYCDGIQQTENDFFTALTKMNRFEVKNKKLLLYQDKLLLLELESD